MMGKNVKYPDAIITDLSRIFASKDSNAATYLSGPKLTSLFSSLGFPDSYQFPNVGIVTPEGSGLSRTAYAYKRLSDLNAAYRLPEALQKFIDITQNISQINDVFNHYHEAIPVAASSVQIQSPVMPITHVNLEQSSPSSKPVFDNKASYDEVFDEIKGGVKVAFISYSWENDNDESHMTWVRKLADDLWKMGIHTLLDQYIPEGYPIPHFMNKGMDVADKIIVIGTPTYKNKSTNPTGGVAYEDSIISSVILQNIPTTKILPVCRKGNFWDSFPAAISNRKGFDFTDDTKYEEILNELARAINNTPKYARPTFGSPPKVDYSDLSSDEKEQLKSPQSDFRKAQDRKIVERLVGNFSFPLMDEYLTQYPTNVDERVFISYDAWSGVIGSSTFRIYDNRLAKLVEELFGLWMELIKLGYIHYSSIPGTRRVKFDGYIGDSFVSNKLEDIYKRMVNIQVKMHPLLKKFAKYIMDNYEIDLDETSKIFIDYTNRDL